MIHVAFISLAFRSPRNVQVHHKEIVRSSILCHKCLMGDQGCERPELFFYKGSVPQSAGGQGLGTAVLCRSPTVPGTNPPRRSWRSQRSAHECQTPTQERVKKEGEGCLPSAFLLSLLLFLIIPCCQRVNYKVSF